MVCSDWLKRSLQPEPEAKKRSIWESTSCHGNGPRPPCSCQVSCSKWVASLCPYRPLTWQRVRPLGRGHASAGNLWRSPSLHPHAPSHGAHLASAKKGDDSKDSQGESVGNKREPFFPPRVDIFPGLCMIYFFLLYEKQSRPALNNLIFTGFADPGDEKANEWADSFVEISLNRMKRHLVAPAEHTRGTDPHMDMHAHTPTCDDAQRLSHKGPQHKPPYRQHLEQCECCIYLQRLRGGQNQHILTWQSSVLWKTTAATATRPV